ncbi:MAG: hypothetical protein A2075_14420 [Geobacteraceae bacterium GWC2_58_44]|nr:MAG: hypothetical protein A2075_14420 [Geobacteraceae bacterium GWC2_58_44]HBG07118.1 DUF2325 domain-containing protein [Geobacter sp.]
MCIALIGGMDRLEKHYREEAERAGMSLQVFSRSETNIAAKLKKADFMVIFTNKVSHRVKVEAMQVAKAQGIPVFMHHACGVCTFRNCLLCFAAKSQ